MTAEPERFVVITGGPGAGKTALTDHLHAMLCGELRSSRMAAGQGAPVLFDRGVPDIVGYPRLEGLPVPDHGHAAAKTFRYRPGVLVAPPWPEIYAQDSEREQS